jgi:uncharacterized protein YbjT (DUF2867 family)
VQHIVKLSVLGASSFSRISILRKHWLSERYIENSGIPCTFIRPSWFMQNLLRMASSVASEGKLYSFIGDGRVSMIDARDIAAAAVECLTEPGYQGRIFEITGPEALSYYDVAAKLSSAIDREVTCIIQSPDTARQEMVDRGAPDWLIDDYMEFGRFFAENAAEVVTPFVAQLTGQAPINFDKFASDYAPAFSVQRRMAA